MKRICIVYLLMLCVMGAMGQRADYTKMSALVRRIVIEEAARQQNKQGTRASHGAEAPLLTAFVCINGDAGEVLRENRCTDLAQFGTIHIAAIPIDRLSQMSIDRRVLRIEARQGMHALLDSMAVHIDAIPVYAGMAPLSQAYTGKGVVMGIQDVGFDLTHPNFYDAAMQNYRIKQLWDQLSADTLGSRLYVGAEYKGKDALLAYAHSRDGLKQTHGTQTLGIAAGSGAGTNYRGIAYESDICLVSNAISADKEFIDSADIYKYTYATDALGFKYIFDYAKTHGQPCVISFSEGSPQDFRGDDVLYYEVLDSLVGPGRIIVSSAANESIRKTYIIKERARKSAGTFFENGLPTTYFTLKSDARFTLRMVAYGAHNDTISIPSQDILARTDSQYVDTVTFGGQRLAINIAAYRSCYNRGETVFDAVLSAAEPLGARCPVSLELVGEGSEVEFYRGNGTLTVNSLNPNLCDGEPTHNIFSPSSAACVVCVGASAYRTGFTNSAGEYIDINWGTGGAYAGFSSVGPTYDGRIKPDVVAPGTNIVSSYSSYFVENNPTEYKMKLNISYFTVGGRTYAWNCDGGTSFSAPAVGGAIALWLQAKPDLTREQIMDVFAHTCTRYDRAMTYPNNYYGYGQIDVYKGLLYILGLSGVEGISDHHPSAVRVNVTASRQVVITFDDVARCSFSVNIYGTSGSLIGKRTFAAGQSSYAMDMTSLPEGVYVIQVNGGTRGTTGSVLVRL
ncbi:MULTISPECIES: S8 family serine peptidase [Prevotellaceae]|uniref:S8 family serine peptidase n=1 Tax=Prevotellaceae TaxID=171552 RepID=UPI0003D2A065|nr:S8 family serine peptidase [Prevotella phocaeensis]ETD17384.1 hypothetical protein HMPREF1199_01885 [Hoylesella oralis CC98A]